MKNPVIILIFTLTALSLKAQMTLHDCLVYARDNAHSNVISRMDIDKAKIDRDISASSLMPYLGLYSNGNLSFGRNIDPETNTYDNRKTISTSFGISMSLPLFDGLVSVNNLKAAKLAVLRQVKATQVEEDMLSLNVIKAFYNVSYCKALVNQIEDQLLRDSTDLRATRKAETLGTKSGADLAELEAIVATDIYELTYQRNLLAKAYLDLKGYMGMEPTPSPINLVETDRISHKGGIAVNPKIEEAEYAYRQSKLLLRAAKGAYSPTISLSGGISTSYYQMLGEQKPTPNFKQQWHNNMGQYLGVSFSLPIFTGLATTKRLKRAVIEVEQRRQRLQEVKYEVAKEIAEATLDLKAAKDELQAAIRRVDAEETAYTAVRRKYELGMTSATDLYTSSAKLAQAKANLEGKRIQLIISRITLDYYHGAKLID